MNAYSQRQGKTLDTLRFLYDGERINGNDTPEKVCYFPVLVTDYCSFKWKMKILSML